MRGQATYRVQDKAENAVEKEDKKEKAVNREDKKDKVVDKVTKQVFSILGPNYFIQSKVREAFKNYLAGFDVKG